MEIATAGNTVAAGNARIGRRRAPAGLVIVGASVPTGSDGNRTASNDGERYGGGFYWAGGGAAYTDGETSAGLRPDLDSATSDCRSSAA